MARPRFIPLVALVAVPAQAIGAAELRRIFMKQQQTWDDGTPVAVAESTNDANVRDTFYRIILKSTVTKMTSYWVNATMTGAQAPPRAFGSPHTLLLYLARTPGGIGYVPENTVLVPGVKRITLQ